ncbi:MAG: hypothetical protein QM478_00080 [Flavobacteriaceae bacterium]
MKHNLIKPLIIAVVMLLFLQTGYTQNYKFGKVSKEELAEKVYPLDSSAHAAYLYKRRRTYTETNSTGTGFVLITDIHVRLKLYNKEGFDWATEEVNLVANNKSKSEKAYGFKAVTYNLVDNKIEKTKLDKHDIFTENKNDNWKIKKFTMSNLKEGCVVEWAYRISSPFFTNIDDVVVQYEIPVKRYETEIELLEWFRFNKRQKGYFPIKIVESSKTNMDLRTNDKLLIVVHDFVPALKVEPYVNNMDNYTAGIQIEVAQLDAPDLGLFENYTTSWNEIAENIFRSSAFGGELRKTRHLNDDIITLKIKLSSLDLKIAGALQYVKSKIKWNGNYGEYPEKGLKEAYKEGVGNVGDINLTLVAVLRELGIEANPVLLSTRSNGIPLYPTTKGINYVIAAAETGKGTFLLDASELYSLPNVLPLRAVNWNGMLIRGDGSVSFVDLSSLTVATQDSNLSYKIDNEGFVEGMNRVKYSNLLAINYRNQKGGKDEDDIISDIEAGKDDIEILNFRVSNVDDLSKPVVEMYKFEKEDGAELIADKMYITPLLFLATDENPFKLDSREYPVDFGTPWQDKIVATITIPEEYVVESVPEDLAIGLRDDLGKFIYSVKTSGNKIQVTSLFEINSGVISATYYAELKGLFKELVAKQTEKIVLIKIE